VNLGEPPLDKSAQSRVSNSVVVALLVIIGALVLLAAFANIQRFWQHKVETVVIKAATAPTPEAQ